MQFKKLEKQEQIQTQLMARNNQAEIKNKTRNKENSPKNQPAQINGFSIHRQFKYTEEIMDTFLLTTDSKKIQDLEINLTKRCRISTAKTLNLWRDKDTRKWRDSPCLWTGNQHCKNDSVHIQCNPNQNPCFILYTNGKRPKILKFICNLRRSQTAKTILSKQQCWEDTRSRS